MPAHDQLIQELHAEVAAGMVPESMDCLVKRLAPLADELRHKIPVIATGARLFRIRKMNTMPHVVDEVGAPPPGVAPIGRLNDVGQVVLYLADSPDTAFSEARATTGEYCLSEWRVQQPKVALANGGIPADLLRTRFPNNFDSPGMAIGGKENKQILSLFRALYTLPVAQDATDLYRWSIGCGFANGFSHLCERAAVETVGETTILSGQYPFSGIAYPSVRKNKQSINYAFNDLGITYLRLDHVQWVERYGDGSVKGIDFAASWDADGRISWQGRPAHYQLQPGESSRVVKIAETLWSYESLDGGIPFFV